MSGDNIRYGAIGIDSSGLEGFLSALGSKKMQNRLRAQLKASARIIQLKTLQKFMAKYNYHGAWKQETTRKSGKKRTKTREVAKVTSKNKSGLITVKVHIMDDYKVKWLEMGTKQRTTKGRIRAGYYRRRPDSNRKYFLRVGKPANRGKIIPGRFFESAVSVTQNEVSNDWAKRLANVVKKASNNG